MVEVRNSQHDPAPVAADGIVLNPAELAAVVGPLKNACADLLPVLRISGFIFWFDWHISGRGRDRTGDQGVGVAGMSRKIMLYGLCAISVCSSDSPTIALSTELPIQKSARISHASSASSGWSCPSSVPKETNPRMQKNPHHRPLHCRWFHRNRQGVLSQTNGKKFQTGFCYSRHTFQILLSYSFSFKIVHTFISTSAQRLTRRQSYYSPFFGLWHRSFFLLRL